MSVKERVHHLVEALSEHDLLVVERILRGLTVVPEHEGAAPRQSAEERKARVYALAGSLRHMPTSVDDFLRQKHEDTEREEARLARGGPRL